MNTVWVRIVSWHVVEATFVSRANRPLAATLCSRVASGEIRDERPSGKTCETCLRILTKSA